MTPPRGRAGRARPGGPTRGRSSVSSPRLPFRRCRLIHAVEVAFESIHVSGPELAERSQPGLHLQKWFWLQPVETALCVYRGFYETGLAQHSQVLGHGRLPHTKPTLDLSHRLLGRDQEAQDRAAVRLRNDCEHRFHALNILHRAYACQGIYWQEATHPAVPFDGCARRSRATSLLDVS